MSSCTSEQGKQQARDNANMKGEKNGVWHSCKWSWVLVQCLWECTTWDTGEITQQIRARLSCDRGSCMLAMGSNTNTYPFSWPVLRQLGINW